MAERTPGITFRPDIQGLRAIAVVLVVLAHAGVPGFAGGFIGVDVFFVLSGYLITGLLLEERLASGSIRYREFLARRLRRLLPAMLTMLLVILLISVVLLTAYEMRMQSRSFPYAAAWISNFFFAFAERDYFKALQDEDLFLHTWSLGVEEQFYLIWPWLILVFAGLKTHGTGRAVAGRTVVAAFVITLAASLILSLYLSRHLPLLAFYMMPSRIWQFALGAIVYAAMNVAREPHNSNPAPGPSHWLAGAAGAALVIGSGMMLGPELVYPGWYALLPSVGAALLIMAGTHMPRHSVSSVLSSRPFVWVGDRSYSIYLWHWPFLMLGNAMGVTANAVGAAVLVAVALVIADLSYRFVEYPFWKGRFREVIPRHVVLHAATAIVLCATAYFVLERQVFGAPLDLSSATAYDPRNDADPRVYSASRDCDRGHLGADLVPCTIGNSAGPKLAILIGDSIGAQWSPTLSGLLAEPDWQIVVLTKSACGIVDKTWYYDKAGGDYVVCTQWREKVIDYVSELGPDLVFIGSSAVYNFSADDWIGGTARVLTRLAPQAQQVVLIAGIPRLSFDGPSCLEDPWRFSFRLIDGTRECEEARHDRRPEEVSAYLSAAAQGHANVDVLDLSDVVCPGGLCAAATLDGVPVFRDKTHVTASFARHIVPEVRTRLQELGVSLAKPGSGSD
ncbi:MAG: acyltransferase family protein [Woeseiaceae bacterium]|nr:acyltransferase family protein [Woeseiaceae bacterium]